MVIPHHMKKENNTASSPIMSTSSPPREPSGSANGDLEEKPRLSEREKKANHIASGSYVIFSGFMKD